MESDDIPQPLITPQPVGFPPGMVPAKRSYDASSIEPFDPSVLALIARGTLQDWPDRQREHQPLGQVQIGFELFSDLVIAGIGESLERGLPIPDLPLSLDSLVDTVLERTNCGQVQELYPLDVATNAIPLILANRQSCMDGNEAMGTAWDVLPSSLDL